MDEASEALGDLMHQFLRDRLVERDGRMLGELEAGQASTRFGGSEHRWRLAEAGLVLTRRRGREKLQVLEPVPIRLVLARVVSRESAPWASVPGEPKRDLEGATMEKIFEIYIKATPERVWEAITDPTLRRRYAFGVGVASEWTPGSSYTATTGPETVSPGMPISEGENLEIDPPRRLVQSFRALWGDDVAAEGTSRVTWELEPVADSCRLTVTHDQLREGANDQLYGGWPMVLSGLKTLLETGEDLTTPASLMYLSGARAASGVGPETSRQMDAMPGRRED
jgi:uncharacterized protein YndB with AHSA1/START domain